MAEAYRDSYGWVIDWTVDDDMTEATEAEFLVTSRRGKEFARLPAQFELRDAAWHVFHSVAQDTFPDSGTYYIQPVVRYGVQAQLLSRAQELRILDSGKL